jgi:hypothetical protein
VAEQPEREERQRPEDEPASSSQPSTERAHAKRIPDHDPEASEVGQRYMSPDDPPLKVTVDGGNVTKRYAPGDLIGRMVNSVTDTIKAFGGGHTPMIFRVAPGHSMTLIFGDPDVDEDEQATLRVEITRIQAQRVAELLELEGEDFFRRALVVGASMRVYRELAHVVQNEGIRMRWEVRGEEPRTLSPERAQRQHALLSVPPQTQDRPLTVNGVLYRVLTELTTRDDYLGSVGIHLHGWSARPPRVGRNQRVIAYYEDPELEDVIKAGLIGESVEAKLKIRQPRPGTSIDPERFELVLSEIKNGPPEGELTASMFEDFDE